jgi:hypothetical protein
MKRKKYDKKKKQRKEGRRLKKVGKKDMKEYTIKRQQEKLLD